MLIYYRNVPIAECAVGTFEFGGIIVMFRGIIALFGGINLSYA
ncbi:hypothetical protein [Bacillus sp. FJAT-49736]|nr:hypothetical protein [Bacillus sp. FJAT-49736]